MDVDTIWFPGQPFHRQYNRLGHHAILASLQFHISNVLDSKSQSRLGL
jgi:hypothetical protein